MRLIEHRRHSMRTVPGDHLNQAGVSLARTVGAEMGPFDLVITSTLARAFETAIAMGFAVHEQTELLSSLPDGFEREAAWDAGFDAFAQAAREQPRGVVATFASELARFHRDVLARLDDGGSALIVSHGALVEASALGCLAGDGIAGWGAACSYCEGFGIASTDGAAMQGKLLRV